MGDTVELSAILGTGRREDRRIDLGIAMITHPVIGRVDDSVTDTLDRSLLARSQVQMTVVIEKLDPMFFLTERVVLRQGDERKRTDVDLVDVCFFGVSGDGSREGQR